MISTSLFVCSAIIAAGGAILIGNAKSGEQSALGGAIAFFALLVASLGALMRVAGISY